MTLTARQVEIARLVAAGRSYKAIARQLGISVRTVETHVEDASSRLPDRPGIRTPRMRLVLWVIELMQGKPLRSFTDT